MDPQPAVRVVRPRPLGLTDRIPVFWAGQEPTQELKQIDGGALYRHLVAAGTPTTSKKRKRGHKYQAPKEGAPHEHFTGLEPQQQPQQQQLPEAAGPIHIPRVRDVADYDLNREAAAHHGPMIEGDMATAPYLRHKEHLHVYDDHLSAEYDADDADMAWLDKINSKGGPSSGILAAAIGLYHQVSARISRTSDHSTGSEAQQQHQQPPPLLLAVDDFERAIELLEKAHFDAVKAWWDDEQAGPSTSAPRVPTIPAMKALLPRATALDVVSELLPDRKLAAQLLDYWLKKRAQEGGPLLARLWFEQPWKLVAFAHDIVDDDEDFDEHLPFMAVEPRSKQKVTRRGGQRRRLREDDALEALHSLRNELETVRTLADQVRKREKLKKQLLLVSQQEWQARRQLGLPPGKAAVAAARKAAGGAHKAGTSKAPAAAGTSKAAAAAAGWPGPSAGRGGAAAGPSPRAAAGGGFGQAGGAAGRPVPAIASPPGSPNTVLNKALARVALATAAAASPHEGDKGRQTRTSAAAAAAEFDLTFAAKRRRLLAAKELAESAAAGGTGAAAAAAAGAPAEAGPSRLQKRGQPAAAAAAASKPPQAAGRGQGRGGRRKGSAAAAAAAAAADDDGAEEQEASEQAPSGSPSAGTEADSEAEYAADDDELSSDDTELPSGLVYETAATAGQQQQQQQGQARKGRQKPLREKLLGRGRGSCRAAAAAARAATAGQIAAEEASSGFVLVSDDSSSDEEEGDSVQGMQKARQGRRQQQQTGKVQQKQQANHAAAGARGANRRNGLVGRGAAVLPPVASSSELQAAAAADSGSDSDSFMQPSKRRRRQAGAAAAAAGPAPPAAAAAAMGRQGAEAPQVLKPLNQQVSKQLRSNADAHKGAKASSPPAAAAAATGAVAASSGRGAAVPRPVSGGNRGHGSGGSVRRSTAGAAAARRKPASPKRRQRGGNELRSLGVAAPVGPRRKAH